MVAPIWQPNCRSRHKEMINYRLTFSGSYLWLVAGLTLAMEFVSTPSKPGRTANGSDDLCV
jgi:hypothetical protein